MLLAYNLCLTAVRLRERVTPYISSGLWKAGAGHFYGEYATKNKRKEWIGWMASARTTRTQLMLRYPVRLAQNVDPYERLTQIFEEHLRRHESCVVAHSGDYGYRGIDWWLEAPNGMGCGEAGKPIGSIYSFTGGRLSPDQEEEFLAMIGVSIDHEWGKETTRARARAENERGRKSVK